MIKEEHLKNETNKRFSNFQKEKFKSGFANQRVNLRLDLKMKTGVSLLYPFICWRTLRVLPCLDYCKQCCNEHSGACVFSNYSFLQIYAQEYVY